MNTRKFLTSTTIKVLAVIAIGTSPWLSAQNAPNAAPKVPVKVEPLQRSTLTSTFNVHGTIYGKGDVNLTAGANGKLVYVAEPGQFLAKGDVVARIDMLPLQLEQQEQALLIERAEINLAYQQTELARLEKLASTNAAAANQLDLTKNQRDLAQSDINLAKLKLKRINDRIARATVTAPFDGIVSQRFEQAGSDVNRAENIVRFLDTEQLEVRMFVPVKYLTQMKTDMAVSIKSNGNTTIANVTAVIPATDTKSQTIEVRARLEQGIEEHAVWATGQLVDIEVPIVNNQSTLLVNRDALIIRRNGVHIVKIDADNKAVQIPVVVGKGQGQLVEVTPVKNAENALSLHEGDNIAVRGAERLRNDQEVEVQTVSS